MDSRSVNIYVNYLNNPILYVIYCDTTVEDIINDTCNKLEISPATKTLFGLKIYKTNPSQWLHLAYKPLENKTIKNYEVVIRYNVPDAKLLRSIDMKTYEFFFKQVRNGVLHDRIPSLDYEKYESDIHALCVIDMYRATIEDNVTRKQVKRKYEQYLPPRAKKAHRWFLKRPILEHFEKVRVDDNDIFFVKDGYLELFQNIAPNYLDEEYDALIFGAEVRKGHIRVSPFDSMFPGISVLYENKTVYEHICDIYELCFINVIIEGNLQISRKNGAPIFLKFAKISTMISFITLLDGYYRLMVKWTFNLCSDFLTPSLAKLQKLVCHGPVSGEFAYLKLAEKRNNKVGTFLLRESDVCYDQYFVDVCTKDSSVPITLKITKTIDKQFVLEGEDVLYPSLPQLIQAHKSPESNIQMLECLPPSEYDKSNLLLCYVERRSKNKENKEEKHLPVCINSETLRVFRNMRLAGSNPYTSVYHSLWYESKDIRHEAATKILNENLIDRSTFIEYLALSSKWANFKNNSVVKFYGFTFVDPLSIVMEYFSLGPLDQFLLNSNNNNKIEEVILMEAACGLANALYFLEGQDLIHGNIRCRKLFVSVYTEENFSVKLSDPGVPKPYKEVDFHWIPPEFYEDPEGARFSLAADIWAFATTVWEIFNYGKPPPEGDGISVLSFYEDSRNRLPKPPECPLIIYSLLLECWNDDLCERRHPHGIMRDMNRIFYQVYNSRRKHDYYTITDLPKVEEDAVSNLSKVSEDFNWSIHSESTVNTLLDDNEERQFESDNLSSASTLTSDIQDHVTSFLTLNTPYVTVPSLIATPPTYVTASALPVDSSYVTTPYLTYNGLSEIVPFKLIPGETRNITATNSTSIQSIFELNQEWNLIFCGFLGSGNYGEVFLGKLLHMYEDREERVAVKKLKSAVNCYFVLDDFRREIKIMSELKHPNIVQIRGYVEEPELYLALEYVEYGSLLCYLNINKDRLSTCQLLQFALDIARGMVYLSQQKIVHRDLATRNILVASDYSLKISDFGLARCIGNNDYYFYETERNLPIKWYAPESIEFGKFSVQSDVWSYGITLFEIFSLGADPRLPNTDKDVQEILIALKNGIRLPMPANCPQHIYVDIMIRCWDYVASKRPTFKDLYKMIEDCCPKRYEL